MKKKNEQHQKKRVIVQVKGNDGTMLDTDYQMDMYRKWIENEILKLPEDITVINATEGGAKNRRRKKVMTLKKKSLIPARKKLISKNYCRKYRWHFQRKNGRILSMR